MPLDYQQVRKQIKNLAEEAPKREEQRRNLREEANSQHDKYALDLDFLRDKVAKAEKFNKYLWCAIPTNEAFTNDYLLPDLPSEATIIASDGSQRNPDRHAAVNYSLVNVGAIQMRHGAPDAPELFIQTELFYDDTLYTHTGIITESMVADIRDQREREILAELAEKAERPVITFMDGPIEPWGRETQKTTSPFEKYLEVLSKLHKLGVPTAGYVDKPRSDLIIRMLELGSLDDNKLKEAGKNRWLLGVTDTYLYEKKIMPGARSAIFGIQSLNRSRYQDELAIHFFYLNVSLKQNDPYLVRVEIPAWVSEDHEKLNDLHAILVHQCQVIGNAHYPYLLHRAHETAVVTRDDKEHVDMMISNELGRSGMAVGRKSGKQTTKDTARN